MQSQGHDDTHLALSFDALKHYIQESLSFITNWALQADKKSRR